MYWWKALKLLQICHNNHPQTRKQNLGKYVSHFYERLHFTPIDNAFPEPQGVTHINMVQSQNSASNFFLAQEVKTSPRIWTWNLSMQRWNRNSKVCVCVLKKSVGTKKCNNQGQITATTTAGERRPELWCLAGILAFCNIIIISVKQLSIFMKMLFEWKKHYRPDSDRSLYAYMQGWEDHISSSLPSLYA